MAIFNSFLYVYQRVPSTNSWACALRQSHLQPRILEQQVRQRLGEVVFGAVQTAVEPNDLLVDAVQQQFTSLQHMGVPTMGVPLVIIHFNGIFSYKPSSYWGTPIYGNRRMYPDKY